MVNFLFRRRHLRISLPYRVMLYCGCVYAFISVFYHTSVFFSPLSYFFIVFLIFLLLITQSHLLSFQPIVYFLYQSTIISVVPSPCFSVLPVPDNGLFSHSVKPSFLLHVPFSLSSLFVSRLSSSSCHIASAFSRYTFLS